MTKYSQCVQISSTSFYKTGNYFHALEREEKKTFVLFCRNPASRVHKVNTLSVARPVITGILRSKWDVKLNLFELW